MKINNIEIKIAKSFKQRLIGLMFKKKTNYGLLFLNCNAIHTFFMHFNIDIILLKNNQVIEMRTNIKPNRVIIFKHKKTSIIEIPHNTSLNINIGDLITY